MLARYYKAVAAAIGSAGGTLALAYADGVVTREEMALMIGTVILALVTTVIAPKNAEKVE